MDWIEGGACAGAWYVTKMPTVLAGLWATH